MDLQEARRILSRLQADDEDRDLTPVELEALDIVELAGDAAFAMLNFSCPACGAKLREPCPTGTIEANGGGKIHKRRLRKMYSASDHGGYVHILSGGAPGLNRRRR